MTNYLEQNSDFMTLFNEGFELSYGSYAKKTYDCRSNNMTVLPLVLVEVAPGCKLSTVFTGNSNYNLLACPIGEYFNQFYDTVLRHLPYTHRTERIGSHITKIRKNDVG